MCFYFLQTLANVLPPHRNTLRPPWFLQYTGLFAQVSLSDLHCRKILHFIIAEKKIIVLSGSFNNLNSCDILAFEGEKNAQLQQLHTVKEDQSRPTLAYFHILQFNVVTHTRHQLGSIVNIRGGYNAHMNAELKASISED